MSKFLKCCLWILFPTWLGLLIAVILPPHTFGFLIERFRLPHAYLLNNIISFISLVRYFAIVTILIVACEFFYITSEDNLNAKCKKWLLENKWFFTIIAISGVLIAYLTIAAIKSSVTGNTEIVALLTVILAFLAILNYVFFELNKKEIEILNIKQDEEIEKHKKKMKEDTEKIRGEMEIRVSDERTASLITSKLSSAYTLWFTHYNLCEKGLIEPENPFIRESINEGRIALEKTKTITDQEKYITMIYKCKNNLLFPIIHLVSYSTEEKEIAIRLSSEIYEFCKTHSQKEISNSIWRLIANRGLTLIRFANDDRAMEEGNEIINRIINDENVLKKSRDVVEQDRKDILEIIKGDYPLKGSSNLSKKINDLFISITNLEKIVAESKEKPHRGSS